jgi:hypothetical protein
MVKKCDSAASIFPPPTLTPTLDVDPWGEDFQDFCLTPTLDGDPWAEDFQDLSLTPTLDVDLWVEDFQELSCWCYRLLQATSSTMVGDRKGSSCIVQDDELNTPEIGR